MADIDNSPATFVRHMTRPDEETWDFYTDYFPMIIPNVIQDRFHLGALAYHDNKMSAERLRIIEGWIYSRGGLIVLMYCSDFRLYRKRLEQDTRSSILTIDHQVQANQRFYGMVNCKKHVLYDYAIDTTFAGTMKYPDEELVEKIANDWLKRRKEYYDGLAVLNKSR
jgi:hypothetical protein